MTSRSRFGVRALPARARRSPSRSRIPVRRLVASAVLATTQVYGAPQWNSAIDAGIAGVSDGSAAWDRTRFYGALRGGVLFLRDGPRSVGVGPALEVGTTAFSDFRAILGGEALLPIDDLWAVAIRPAAYERNADGRTLVGASVRGWFGIQTYNYDGAYAPRGGLVVGYDQDLGASSSHAIVVSAEVDGLVLALPVLLLYEWIRGPSE